MKVSPYSHAALRENVVGTFDSVDVRSEDTSHRPVNITHNYNHVSSQNEQTTKNIFSSKLFHFITLWYTEVTGEVC